MNLNIYFVTPTPLMVCERKMKHVGVVYTILWIYYSSAVTWYCTVAYEPVYSGTINKDIYNSINLM